MESTARRLCPMQPTSRWSEHLIWPESGVLWLLHGFTPPPEWEPGEVRCILGKWHTSWRRPAAALFEIAAAHRGKELIVYSAE